MTPCSRVRAHKVDGREWYLVVATERLDTAGEQCTQMCIQV